MNEIQFIRTSTPPDAKAGTLVSWRDEKGKVTDGKVFYSVAWTARQRPRAGGCPQWIRYVIIGDSLAAAKKAASDGLGWETQIASSSRSSQDLQVIHVDTDGAITNSFQVPYALVPKVHPDPDPKKIDRIADELWFAKQPFDPNLKLADGQTVKELEGACNKEVAK